MRCKSIKTYVPSIQEGTFHFYYIAPETFSGNTDGYVVNGMYILSKDIFYEHFVDCAEVRDRKLEELGI